MNEITSSGKYLINKYLIEGLLIKVPFVGKIIKEIQRLKRIARACGHEPGHFYSPIPSLPEVKASAERIFSSSQPLDIELKLDDQLKLLETLREFRVDFPYDFINAKENHNLRYRWVKGCQYRYSDVVFLYGLV